MEKFQLRVQDIKSYSGKLFLELQTFELSYENILDVRQTSYCRHNDRVVFGRERLEIILMITEYRYEDKLR